MIIICPQCSARFSVADGLVPDTGRKVKCSSCKHIWMITPDTKEDSQETPEAFSLQNDSFVQETVSQEQKETPNKREESFQDVSIEKSISHRKQSKYISSSPIVKRLNWFLFLLALGILFASILYHGRFHLGQRLGVDHIYRLFGINTEPYTDFSFIQAPTWHEIEQEGQSYLIVKGKIIYTSKGGGEKSMPSLLIKTYNDRGCLSIPWYERALRQKDPREDGGLCLQKEFFHYPSKKRYAPGEKIDFLVRIPQEKVLNPKGVIVEFLPF